MADYAKINKAQMAQANKYNVLKCLMRETPINRAAIARKTQLSIPSVMSITDDLLSSGIIAPGGKGESTGGKRPELLELVPDRLFYIGVDVGRTMVRVVGLDLACQVRFSCREATGDPFPERDFVSRLCRLVERCAAALGEAEKIMGVGIAMPGLIERETGRVLFSPDFGWKDVPLQDWMAGSLPYRVLVENANRALALNEVWTLLGADGPGEHTTLCVNLGHGIGGALVLGESDVYCGSSGTSGEIGHITVDRDGPLCACGNAGCLEAVASGEAIARQARDTVAWGISSQIASLSQGHGEAIDAKLVFEAARLGDETAGNILARAAEYIGIGLATAINLLDPDWVVLCGGLMKNGPKFLEAIRKNTLRHKMRQAGRRVDIRCGTLEEYSTAVGACRVVANELWRRRELPV